MTQLIQPIHLRYIKNSQSNPIQTSLIQAKKKGTTEEKGSQGKCTAPCPGKPVVHKPRIFPCCPCPLSMLLTRCQLSMPSAFVKPVPGPLLALEMPSAFVKPVPDPLPTLKISSVFVKPFPYLLPMPSAFTASALLGVIPPFKAGDWNGFINTIEHIAKTEVQAPSASQFCFEYTMNAMEHNNKLLKSLDYDLESIAGNWNG